MKKKHNRRGLLEISRLQFNKKTYRDALARFFKKNRPLPLTGALLFIFFLLLCGIFNQLPGPLTDQPPGNVTTVSFETFVSEIKTGNMRTVTIQGNQMTANLARSLQGRACDPSAAAPANEMLKLSGTPGPVDPACTIYLDAPTQSTGTLLPLFLHAGVIIKTQPAPPAFFPLLRLFCLFALAMVLFIAVEYFFRRNRRSTSSPDHYSQFLKSRARRVTGTFSRAQARSAPESPPGTERSAVVPARSTSRVRFTDVAGIDEARAELEEIVQFLRNPERFQRLGAHVPRGVLLVGLPGTGKTLLAKAVAGEANVPFFQMSASEFVELFVGVGASRVRDLFQQARQSAPCVIFLDEIDAVGHRRSLRPIDSGERDQTLNQLLVELDGFGSSSAVVVLAATNRVDILDSALLRPGRFDRRISIALPDRRGREAILRVHTRQTPLNARVRLDHLARLTIGMSGAELANLVNEAALCAARRDLPSLTPECFEEALARIQLGVQRRLVLSERERRVIAFHECGHALVAFYMPEADPVNHLTILPRGEQIGVTQFTSQEERYTSSRASLMARIAVGLGGRIAVELAFGSEGVTTRAEDDLQSVTALAWRMVTHWGMGKEVGVFFADACNIEQTVLRNGPSVRIDGTLHDTSLAQQSFPSMKARTQYISSPSMAAMIDSEVQHIVEEGHKRASCVLREHYDQLTHLVDVLMEQERLDRQQFEAILQD